jgi:hypothetical protein
MVSLQCGDQIELSYEDASATTIRATVGRLLSDQDEGMGIEVEDHIACWSRLPWTSQAIWMPKALCYLALISSIA